MCDIVDVVQVWCRQNLYTPCTSPEDRLSCSPVNNSPTNELSLLARSILVQGVSPRDISMKEDSLEVDVISQTSGKCLFSVSQFALILDYVSVN